MTKKPAFSLMEVMVILLIMAVTLAATAPMISKKMSRNVGTAEEPWKFTGSNESISFNGNGRDNLTVFIGADRFSLLGVFNNLITAVNSAPLYLRSPQRIPHISLASETFGRWDRGAGGNGRYYNDVSGQAQNHIGSRLVGYLGFVTDNANIYGRNNIPNAVANFQSNISLPYLSSKLPWDANNNVQRGIVFGNRLGFRGNTLDPALAGVDGGGGTFEDIIQDKIVIGHDSQIMSMIGGNTEDLRDIILIGSDAGIRGSFNTIVGRGIGFTHANRAIVRNTVFINSRRPGLPRFNNNNQFMANDVFYCVLFNGPDGNDNESNDFANNGNVPINRVNDIEGISAITGIGRGLFTSGSGHTLIGNMAHCGHDTPVIIGNNGFHGLISSFNSVALGSEVIAAGSNCVAIGAGIVAGFPRVNGRVTPEVNDPNRPGRYNTVAIGSNGNPNTFNVNAGNAVALGTNPSIHEGRAVGAVHPEFGISIGTDSEVWLPSGISIGQQAVAEGNSGIAIGSNDTNPTHVLGDNSIAIGSAARVIQPNGRRANNAIAIGAGITANANDEIRFGNNSTTFRFGGNSVQFPGGDNNRAKATIRSVYQSGCDIRLKNVGEKLASGLEDIKKLEFFNFTYKKDKENKPHVGVMAQDLQKVFPTSVSEGSDGYLRIRRDEMFYAALNAIKELDAKIIALASELKSFFDRVDKLVEKSNFGVQIARNQASLDNLKSESADIEARLARLEEE